jgi:hypothetical protein
VKARAPGDSLACPHCGATITPLQALQGGTVSWPTLAGWWVLCPACGRGSHFRVERGRMAQYVIVGAPGPMWEHTHQVPVPGLTRRADPSFMHVWLDGRHFEFPARDDRHELPGLAP